jgi:hypothetical protein
MREIFRTSGGFDFCQVIASCYILSAQSQSQSPPPQQPPGPSSSAAAASPPKSPAQAVGLFVLTPSREQCLPALIRVDIHSSSERFAPFELWVGKSHAQLRPATPFAAVVAP